MTPTPVAELAGEIVISFQSNDTQTFEALCAAYEELNPGVDCIVELKPPEGYQEWIRTQFAGGVPDASLVNGNVVADLINDKKFLDLSTYFDRESRPTRARRGARTSTRQRWPICAT